jgi:translation elongation factor EF-1alpha
LYLNTAIETNDDSVKWAVSGDRVSLHLPNIEEIQIQIGSIICDTIPQMSTVIEAHVSTLDSHLTMVLFLLTQGMPLLFHHLSTSTPAILTKILVDGKVKRTVAPFKIAKVTLEVERGVVREVGCKSLTRFTLRSLGKSIAAGLIL